MEFNQYWGKYAAAQLVSRLDYVTLLSCHVTKRGGNGWLDGRSAAQCRLPPAVLWTRK
jgi:hypothetical protein